MRKVVVVEGKLLPNGMMLMPGALKDPGKPIAVTMGFDHQTIVGKATDFERNTDTGEISFDIQFSPAYAGGKDLIEDAEIQLSAYGLELNGLDIESAKVGAAVFIPFGGIPKAVDESTWNAKDEPGSMRKAVQELVDLVNSGYVKVPEQPVEGKVVERSWMTVGELIEKLKEFDQNLPVVTNENEYGLEVDVEPRLYKLESWEVHTMRALGMEEGDRLVVID